MAIIELDDDTVRQIAAGEVVERPASVVKELVENSLDAEASRIRVEIDRGGKERIAVVDDGMGMTSDEVQLAVRQHTTSKIGDVSDLIAGVGTLGFRGEALYAIGAVSTMTVTTRPHAGDEATLVTVERGDLVDVSPAGRAPGTTVEVTNLFSGVPAREKFLASDATEFDRVNRIASRYALAYPEVALSLRHDGRQVFATTGQNDLTEAILSVYGRTVAESMLPVDGAGVSGVVSHPETTRSTRDYISTFVNGRYVASSDLRGAIVTAYGRQLANDRYPFAVVFVEIDPSAVDINVHPRKLEVRFDDPTAVRDRVRAAVEDALLTGGLIRTGAPRGKSAPAEVEPRPLPSESDNDDPADRSTRSDLSRRPAASIRGQPETGHAPLKPGGSMVDHTPPSWHSDRRFEIQGEQSTFDVGRAADPPASDRLPSLRVLGQLDGSYLVCEASGGLILVDQHAADERVHYERLSTALADDQPAQTLAEPVELELTAREVELFPAFVDALESLGFRATSLGERTVKVTAVPGALAGALDAALLRDALPELVRVGEATSVDARIDALVADLACHPAITAHTSLTEGSVRALLEALDACENPYACPHGRPTMIEVSADEIAERFERDYPGHANRRDEV